MAYLGFRSIWGLGAYQDFGAQLNSFSCLSAPGGFLKGLLGRTPTFHP